MLCLGDPILSTGWGLASTPTNTLHVTSDGLGGASNGCESDVAWSDNVWKHVAVTRDSGDTWRMYIEGELQAGTSVTNFGVIVSGPSMWNGSGNNATFRSEGYYSLVAWYPSALSGARILAHYDAAFLVSAADQPNMSPPAIGGWGAC